MSSNGNQRNYSHVVHVNILDQMLISCYTNNPNNVTLNTIKEGIDKMNININISDSFRRPLQNKTFTIHYRTEESTNNYDDLDTSIKFNDNQATVYLVVEHYFPEDNQTYYTPKENSEYILNRQYENFEHTGKTFNVFCRLDKSYVFTICEDMLVGNLAYQLCQKFNMRMHKIRLICGHQLPFDKPISDTVIGKDSTIFVLPRASHYMYTAESNIEYNDRYCLLDDN